VLNIYRSQPILVVITLVLSALSVFADLVSISIGVAWGKGGYLNKLNWALFPAFYVVLGVFVHASWALHMRAWRSLATSGVLYRRDAEEVNECALDTFLDSLRARRFWLVLASVILGLTLTGIDAGCLWMEYGVLGGNSGCKETDFSVAFRLGNAFSAVGKTTNGFFNLFVYLLQGGLIAYAWLVLMQISLHGFYFWRFEHNKIASENGLTLRLNIEDPLREFGLAEVNRAINTVYITIALGMMIPVLSAFFQQPGTADRGQLMLRFLLPLVLLSPLVVPLVDRYLRVKDASARVLEARDETKAEKFRAQKLWPFEGTQIGYLGKTAAGIAVVEYIYLFTRNFLDILKW
jgi:hypothetical protein